LRLQTNFLTILPDEIGNEMNQIEEMDISENNLLSLPLTLFNAKV